MDITIESYVTVIGETAKGRVVAKLAEALIHEDRIDLATASHRTRFGRAVAKAVVPGGGKRVAYKVTAVEKFVEKELLSQLNRARANVAKVGDDVDVSRIVRPDLFITPEVVGLTIPAFSIVDGKPAGKWVLYLHWADGRREKRELPHYLELQGGSCLWFHPEPTPPPADLQPAWSAGSRKAWLSGEHKCDPAGLFTKLRDVIIHFVDLPAESEEGIASTVALWIMLTYLFPAWDAVPYLYGGGPAGSGKTRLFIQIAQRLARAPVESSNISASALFRRLHDRGGTLLLDEAERLKEGTPEAGELRSILLAGYKRGGRATRNEPVGDGRFRQVEFDVFGPKAVVCVNGLPPTLATRCISTVMFRSSATSEKPRRRLDETPELWAALRDDLHILALESGNKVLALSKLTDVCPAMSGRHYELWQPLLALASWVEDEGVEGLLSMLQAHALETINNNQEDQTPETDETLLTALVELVKDPLGPLATPALLLSKVREADQEAFRKWTPRTVSNTLRRYNILTRQSHGVRAFRDITLEDLALIQKSYSIDLGLEGS